MCPTVLCLWCLWCPQARQNFGLVELDGLVYVLGGENDVCALTSVEVFDPHSSTWRTQTSMTMIRKVTQTTDLVQNPETCSTTLFNGSKNVQS